MNVFAFDIETVPDVATGRRLLAVADLPDAEVAELMFQQQRRRSGGTSDFLPLAQHRVVAIAACLHSGEQFRVWSLGEPEAEEAELIGRFFDGIERLRPTIVSWNGAGFDLPVLHYRALLHGISAPCYWDTGELHPSHRYNNYLGRFHWRHLDLMDVLAGYQPRGGAKLEDIALMLGLPGKLGMSGGAVWPAWQAGERERIRNYCELDVLNTFLIYLRFELMRGRLTADAYGQTSRQILETLATAEPAHLRTFAERWRAAGGCGLD